jgi:tRNA pseudouridine38-40 synthase
LDLLKALAISGATSADNAMDMVKIGFVRAARTDKGVHALGQMVSLKMVVDEGVIERLNAALPPQIRVWGESLLSSTFDSFTHTSQSRIHPRE